MISGNSINAEIVFFPPNENGRVDVPVGDGYAPYFVIGDKQYYPVRINGMPKLNGEFNKKYVVEIELMYPSTLDYSPLFTCKKFEIVEGIKVIGKGIILPIQ